MGEQMRPTSVPRKIGGWSVAALVLVIALSVIVGFVGGEDGFDWDLAAVFGTALGTTLLALATGLLALLTWRGVRATQELATLTQRDQQARERPVVIQQHASFSISGVHGRLAVTLVNVGLGPALRVEVRASYIDPDHQPEIQQVTRPAIQPGESDRFELDVRFTTPPPAGVQGDGFPLSGTYLDRSQRNDYPIITDWQAGPPRPE